MYLEKIYTKDEIEDLAVNFSKNCLNGHCFFLFGDLGTGKTTFAKSFIKSFLNDENVLVTSPTFNIMQSYSSGNKNIIHADLYRLKSYSEIEDLGLIDLLFNSVSLIEWPEVLLNFDLDGIKKTSIYFSFVDNNTRSVKIE